MILNFVPREKRNIFMAFIHVDIDTSIKIEVDEGVYPPSEDSYLLLQYLDIGKEKMLEIGTGTGIIALHAAKKGADVTAVDKNGKAVSNALRNAKANGINMSAQRGDGRGMGRRAGGDRDSGTISE